MNTLKFTIKEITHDCRGKCIKGAAWEGSFVVCIQVQVWHISTLVLESRYEA